VDLTILPAHVGTRAILAKGTIRIFRRYVSWVTTTALMHDILDHCCYACNSLIEQPWVIMSIGLRKWAHQ